MAKAVVGMKLSVARVAYPRADNVIKPAVRIAGVFRPAPVFIFAQYKMMIS